ncbi:MAG: PQQ-dependent sugar dehydrogenase [Chloroflexi bacterium]|nr:PQQ-dependent sugar dehydrogenase [Chloroflexota bacterium]
MKRLIGLILGILLALLALSAVLAADCKFVPGFMTMRELIGYEVFDECLEAEVPRDREALVALFNATNGENWKYSGKWLSSAPVGEWHGVTVDARGHVIELRLQRNQLSGEIPPELGNLTSLTSLWLNNNQLSGKIPPELGNLTNLRELRLLRNQLSGEIPPELGNLTNLTELRLNHNQLSGEIPPALGNLASLTDLRLDWNQLSGDIPPELGSLANLADLRLQRNLLSGDIPPALGDLARLTTLLLDNNRLSGAIPPELGRLANLRWMFLHENALSGEIPPQLGSLTNLKALSLEANQLSGAIPSELGSLANLEWMWLYRNQLSGKIPPELGNLPRLTSLWLNHNQLSGEIPPELGNLANLSALRLGYNQLIGEIPPELGNLTYLRELRLGENQLSGEIPPELGNLASLTSLWLHGNQLSGEIPGSPVPVRVAPAVTPQDSPVPLAVALQEVFGGREFEQPIEIGAYPIGPADGAGPGVFVAEREGRILLLHPDGDEAVELLDITDRVTMEGNEEGLLSVALDPRFEETGHLWLFYSVQGAVPYTTRLSRFTVDLADLRRVHSDSELMVIEIEKPYANHNGGSIRFGPDGMLYLGLGDGGSDRDSQNLETLLGSVIRIDVREASESSPYTVPPDNPFVDVPGARPEIWAYGLRNPWRMAFDPATGVLWAGDVGRSDFEEINHIEAGGNYGWNRLEGSHCNSPATGCDPAGTILPVAEYGHHLGCSVSGGVVYRGEAIQALVGHYLFSDFCRGQLWALPPNGGAVVEIADIQRPVSSFGTDADGEVYVLTFWGTVFRLALP